MAEYLVLIYEDEASWAKARPEESEQVMAGHVKFGTTHADALRGGHALEPTSTATSLRSDGAGGVSVTDGPFAETKEALGGYYLIEAADLDEAVRIAKDVPAIFGGIEIRPIRVFD
ncbi:MAG: YCII-related protein [Acidimicrobiaceae bacterium]|jgi:hypothetical protein|nr:YCII-related protein [Acidimicrobiaceae bacterium]